MIPVLRRIAVWSWYVAAVVLVLSASLVSIGQYYFPYLGDYKDQVLQRATAELPFGVEIERLSAEWTGLAPTIHVQGLRLYVRNEPAITILSSSRSEIRIDILRSLLSMAPRLRKIVAENVALEFVESDDGSWNVAGVGSRRGPSNPEAIADFFLAIEEIELRETKLVLKPRSGAPIETRGALLSLENYRRFRRLQIAARDDTVEGDLNLLLETHGDPRNTGDFDALAYVDMHNVQLGRFQPLLGARLKLPDAGLSGRLWVRMDAGARFSWQGQLSAAKLELGGAWPGRQMEPAHALELNAAGEWEAGRGSVWVNRLAFEWYGKTLAVERLRVDVSGDAGKRYFAIGADYLDLGGLAGVLHASAVVPGAWGEALADLEPYGGLADARLSVVLQPSTPVDFRLRARMIDVSVSPWKHAPGVRNANGYLELTREAGHADLASGAISLEFPRLYRQDLAFDSVTGRVSWWRDDEGVRVGSERLRLMDGETALNARFDLEFRRDLQLDDQLSLAVGLRNADLAARNKYLPYLVDAGLRDWLDTSIQGGRADTGAFCYHAIFERPEHAASSTLQLGLDVRDAALSYHPAWPPVREVAGRFILDDSRIGVRAHAGRMLQSVIEEAQVELTPAREGRRLRVAGRLHGDLGDGLQVINESPLAGATGGMLRNWTGHGDLGVALQLDMPFGAALDPLDAHLRVSADIAKGGIFIGDQKLPIDALQGRLTYDLSSGLGSESLSGELWGLPLRASISVLDPDSKLIVMDMHGAARPQRVAQWLGVDSSEYFSGSSQFHLKLEQLAAGGLRTLLDSDLIGAISTLPAPLGKSAEQAMPLHVESLPIATGNEWRIDLDEVLRSALQVDRAGRWSGEVMFGAPAHAGGEGLRISGNLEHVDVGAWIMVSQRLLAANVRGDQERVHGLRFDALKFTEARLLSATLDELQLDSRWESGDFVLGFAADLLGGEFRVPDDHATPYGLKLSRLQLEPFVPLEGDTASEPQPGPWAALRGVQLPPLRVEIAQAMLADKVLGDWSFLIESATDTIALSDVRGSMPGVGVRGQAGQEGASVRLNWLDGLPRTRLEARLKMEDLGEFFQNWGYARLVESRKGKTDIAFEWPGYPTDFAMADVSGLIDFEWKDGSLTQEGSNNPIMRALGILSFNEALRRIKFDFRDLYQEGLRFDRFEAAIDFENGLARTREPVELQGPSARVRMSGQSDLHTRTIDADMVVTLPIGSNLPWVAALAGGLPVAAGIYVASKLFESQIGKFSSAVYKVSGSIDDPQLQFVKVFDVADAVSKHDGKPADAAAPGVSGGAGGETAPQPLPDESDDAPAATGSPAQGTKQTDAPGPEHG